MERRYGRFTIVIAGVLLAIAAACSEQLITARPDRATVISEIHIQPTTDTIAVSETVLLHAEAVDSSGIPVETNRFEWVSHEPDILIVNDTGLVKGIGSGTGTIAISLDDMSDTAAITVEDVNQQTDIAIVRVQPATATINVSETVQLTAEAVDSNGAVVQTSGFDWHSVTPNIVTVNQTGFVEGIAEGAGIVEVSIRSAADSAYVSVVEESTDTSGRADPTLLPTASGQLPQWNNYIGASLSAGESYIDPVSEVRVWKVTDANTPRDNARGIPDYSEGGPYISLPWGNPTHYTLYVMIDKSPSQHYLVDFQPGEGFANWRAAPSNNRPQQWAWSMNPATPRIAYYIGGSGREIRRYNTATMAEANTGYFPKNLSEASNGTDLGWFQIDKNDEWFVAQGRFGSGPVVAWNSKTNQVITSGSGGQNEPHLDRGGKFVYIIRTEEASISEDGYTGSYSNILLLDLRDGTISDPNVWNTHPASVVGYMVSENPHIAGSPEYYFDPTTGVITETMGEFAPSSGHRAGQWVYNNDPGLKQWYLFSGWGYGGGDGIVFDAIVFARLDGSDVRLLAHHYSSDINTYYGQPHATISPDGRLVMWGSDQNNSGRVDVYLAEVPTTP